MAYVSSWIQKILDRINQEVYFELHPEATQLPYNPFECPDCTNFWDHCTCREPRGDYEIPARSTRRAGLDWHDEHD